MEPDHAQGSEPWSFLSYLQQEQEVNLQRIFLPCLIKPILFSHAVSGKAEEHWMLEPVVDLRLVPKLASQALGSSSIPLASSSQRPYRTASRPPRLAKTSRKGPTKQKKI
eukprot:1162139-Pelagomonas_calceolata.AAC.4